MLGATEGPLRIVTCYLGAGASLAAAVDGRCVDPTIGFWPLDGLMMATRSGSATPALYCGSSSTQGSPQTRSTTASNTSPASTPSPAPPTCGPCWNDPRPAIKRPNSPSPSTSTGSSQGSLPWPPPAPASTRSCSAAARARAPDPSACPRRPPLPRSVDRRPGQRQSHESIVSSPATSESESSSSVLGKIWRSPRLSEPTLESVGPADALLRRARGGRPGRW
ncbi:hypothetical protein HC251_18755 [Iamia sp. SCSIO 61187]|nr:hypothetical protein HC251_18755 [Iamia sp. SCSIO 61187]